MARVYLDTSFVSACVTTREDTASVYRRETSLEWLATQAHRHELCISTEVLDEVNNPGFKASGDAVASLQSMTLLPITDEVRGVARILIRELVMPGPENVGDAIHVALTMVHGVRFLLSWNVRHLANPNKIMHLLVVSRRLGMSPPAIVTPDLLWEDTP